MIFRFFMGVQSRFRELLIKKMNKNTFIGYFLISLKGLNDAPVMTPVSELVDTVGEIVLVGLNPGGEVAMRASQDRNGLADGDVKIPLHFVQGQSSVNPASVVRFVRKDLSLRKVPQDRVVT